MPYMVRYRLWVNDAHPPSVFRQKLMPNIAAPDIELPDIVLVADRCVLDKHGVEYHIQSITLEAVSHCCDVYINVADALYHCDDETFLANVMALLRESGYVGPDFGRAEMGMQQDDRIALESTDAFQDFALTRGWAYADGNEMLLLNRLLRSIPWKAVVSFRASNGTVYGIPVECIATHHAKANAPRYASLVDSLAQTLVLFRTEPTSVTRWLTKHMTWSDFGELVRLMDKPPIMDVQAEYVAAKNLSVRGLPRA